MKIITIIFIFVCCFGYFNNIIKLTDTDLNTPYRAEFIRGTGVFIFPVGVIAGYLEIEDK